MNMVTELKGEGIGVKEMRKHAAWYLKGMPGSTKIKTEIFRMTTSAEVKNILLEYLEYINKNALE